MTNNGLAAADGLFAGPQMKPCDWSIFDVFYASFETGTGWYWWVPVSDQPAQGPFKTAQGAYLSAIGD